MKKKTARISWTAISALATVAGVVIGILVFFWGEGVLKVSPNKSVDTTDSILLVPFNTAVFADQIPTTPISIDINQTVAGTTGYSVKGFFSVDYLELNYEKLFFYFTINNSENPFNVITCKLPVIVKSNYGALGPIIERGGAFIDVDDFCALGVIGDVLVPMGETRTGWLVFPIDPLRFQLQGHYTIDNIGQFPQITFEVK